MKYSSITSKIIRSLQVDNKRNIKKVLMDDELWDLIDESSELPDSFTTILISFITITAALLISKIENYHIITKWFGEILLDASDKDFKADGIVKLGDMEAPTRVCHQLQEERLGAQAIAGFPRIHVQQQQDGNSDATKEDFQTSEPSSSTEKCDKEILVQVDSELIGEDHSYDTGNGGSTIQSTIPAERYGPIIEDSRIQLGEELQDIDTSIERVELVDREGNVEERTAHTINTERQGAESGDICGRLRHRLGSSVKPDTNKQILVSGRKRNFNQCKGVEDSSVCDSNARRKKPRRATSYLHRQHDRPKACKEAGRDGISSITIIDVGDTATYNRVSSSAGDRKIHANWSLNEDMFEKYYLRPANRRRQGQRISKRILEDTEKKATSEV
ncbi:hypothetical protein RMCBS344292_14468 [Rhizopus microsporus]|nr:hypothetical protein RMCBS344292_14468 [Rhizopus microsporus]